ncbi:hypothetical protein [Bradyrhizobium prioriisuperbiae]|uniref:hypothetical protein n=1 Tax=Bradyrhizobium prioriisuperbiae TaxID=2854389 RepID=UPI0028F0A059|nr:hypothetical protein [Bradyrhizobium prioritasuperba]
MSNEVLKQTVRSVLCNPMLPLINFDLNGLRVTGLGYGNVRLAVESGRITCAVGVQQRASLPAGNVAAAQYDPQNNTFHFSRESFGSVVRSEQAAIVHEATHAQFDLAGPKAGNYVLAIDDEAAAWLAGSLFARLCENNLGGTYVTGVMIPGSAELEALKLADRILAETQDLMKGPKPYRVRADAVAGLRAAVARDYNFLGDHAGIKTVYDGV